MPLDVYGPIPVGIVHDKEPPDLSDTSLDTLRPIDAVHDHNVVRTIQRCQVVALARGQNLARVTPVEATGLLKELKF